MAVTLGNQRDLDDPCRLTKVLPPTDRAAGRAPFPANPRESKGQRSDDYWPDLIFRMATYLVMYS